MCCASTSKLMLGGCLCNKSEHVLCRYDVWINAGLVLVQISARKRMQARVDQCLQTCASTCRLTPGGMMCKYVQISAVEHDQLNSEMHMNSNMSESIPTEGSNSPKRLLSVCCSNFAHPPAALCSATCIPLLYTRAYAINITCPKFSE